jgi:hypothetical protein
VVFLPPGDREAAETGRPGTAGHRPRRRHPPAGRADCAAAGAGGGAGRADRPGRRDAVRRAGNAPYLRAAAGPPLVEPDQGGPRSGDRPAARLRRAGVPAWLRPPRRPAAALLGIARPVSVLPRHRRRTARRPLPAARRTISLLNGQAEYATRVLPALADLMAAETRTGCQHPAPALNGIPLPASGGLP